MADVGHDPHPQAVRAKLPRPSTFGCTQPDKPPSTIIKQTGYFQPDPSSLNNSSRQAGEAPKDFPASRQASTSSGASVREMTPRYPEDAYSPDYSSRLGQGGCIRQD